MSEKISIIGTGLVGRSWSIVFARAGFEVWMFDPIDSIVENAIKLIEEGLPNLFEEGLLGNEGPDVLRARLHKADSLQDALDGAIHAQESAPESIDVKQKLYLDLDKKASKETVLASSTSGIAPSVFVESLEGRHRCLVAHPINPPHIVPLVEIVPSPWTDDDVIEKTQFLMKHVQQEPIKLNYELKGFVANRLQGAILSEAFRLVEDGVYSVNDIDTAISKGLGLRWSFMGPFETIDLNSSTGVRGYCKMLGQLYYELGQEQANPRVWNEELVTKIENQRRSKLTEENLGNRQKWRDQRLAMLVSAKKQADDKLGK